MFINAFTTKYNFSPINTISFGQKEPGKPNRKRYFSNAEGKYALRTNIYVMHNIKLRGKSKFPEATQEDLKILTDKSFDAPSKRVKWFNPKDCQVYYLIKQGVDKNGNIQIRILNEKGKFIKNATIRPKTIVIIDKFEDYPRMFTDGEFTLHQVPYIPHGEMVARYAFVNNPFANYIFADITEEAKKDNNLSHATTRLTQKYQGADEVNFSWACFVPIEFYDDFKNKKPGEYAGVAKNIIREFGGEEEIKNIFADIEETAKISQSIAELAKSGTKVFVSSGNHGEDNFNLILLTKNVEGVGSLNNDGKVSDFVSSRKASLTRHFEQGEYKIKPTKDGVNYTSGEHTDYICNLSRIYRLSGKKLKDYEITQEEFKKIMFLKKNNREEFYKLLSKWAEQNRVVSGKMACKLFGDNKTRDYDNLYLTLGEWVPYELDQQGILKPHYLSIQGTSFSTPIRAARHALNLSMDGII